MTKTYAVVRHTSGRGFVVRTVYDGWLPAPYTNAQREVEVMYEGMARKIAARFNADPAMNRGSHRQGLYRPNETEAHLWGRFED